MAVNVGPQPSQGIGGIPTKYLIIGAGVLGVGALLLMQRKPGAVDPNSGNVQPTGSTSAQLSSVQQLQLSQFGELTKLFQAQSDLIQGQIGGLSAHLDTQAGALSSAIQSSRDALAQGTNAQFAATTISQQNLAGMLWDLFQRASNPAWMPSPGSPNPFTQPRENVAVGGG